MKSERGRGGKNGIEFSRGVAKGRWVRGLVSEERAPRIFVSRGKGGGQGGEISSGNGPSLIL